MATSELLWAVVKLRHNLQDLPFESRILHNGGVCKRGMREVGVRSTWCLTSNIDFRPSRCTAIPTCSILVFLPPYNTTYYGSISCFSSAAWATARSKANFACRLGDSMFAPFFFGAMARDEGWANGRRTELDGAVRTERIHECPHTHPFQ